MTEQRALPPAGKINGSSFTLEQIEAINFELAANGGNIQRAATTLGHVWETVKKYEDHERITEFRETIVPRVETAIAATLMECLAELRRQAPTLDAQTLAVAINICASRLAGFQYARSRAGLDNAITNSIRPGASGKDVKGFLRVIQGGTG